MTCARFFVLKETLEDMDKDKDGSLSVEEYLGDPGVDPDTGNPPDWVSVENTTFYEVRDTNHNGKMDRVKNKNYLYSIRVTWSDILFDYFLGRN